MRNYGDKRIVEFDRLAKKCDELGLTSNADHWRQKAASFRQQHEHDPWWAMQDELDVEAVNAKMDTELTQRQSIGVVPTAIVDPEEIIAVIRRFQQ